MSAPMKGVILAAGLGTRLSPLTNLWPKPLVPFLGTTPLELALYRFHKAGINDIAINSHHLPEQIDALAKKNPFGQKIFVSHESTLLGTGGVYAALNSWRGSSSIFVLNGDIVSDINVAKVIEYHSKAKAFATMVLLPQVIPGETAVWHKEEVVHAITKESLKGLSSGNFACAQILSKPFLDLLPDSGVFDIISKGYKIALERQLRIKCIPHDGVWHDLRTPRYYWEAIKDCIEKIRDFPEIDLGIKEARHLRQLPTEITENYFLDDSTLHSPRGSHGTGAWAMIEFGSHIGSDCNIRNSIVLPGVKVPNCSDIQNQILGPNFSLSIS